MPVTFKLGKQKSVLCLNGQIDIASSAELKKALLDALSAGNRLSVSLELVTDLVVTAVQLLCRRFPGERLKTPHRPPIWCLEVRMALHVRRCNHCSRRGINAKL